MVRPNRASASLRVNRARAGWFGQNRISLEEELPAKVLWFISRPPLQLKLYSREWCSWCIDAKDFLSEKGYSFQEIDVGKDREAYEHMKKLSAQTYVPP